MKKISAIQTANKLRDRKNKKFFLALFTEKCIIRGPQKFQRIFWGEEK